MKRTTVTVVVEHYEEEELVGAVKEVYNRMSEGYVSGHYFGDNDLEVEFLVEETEA